MMSRKDYELIAQAIRDTRYYSGNLGHYQALNDVTFSLAKLLEAQNPRFDVAKFFQACEYGKMPRESEVVA
jgi:hypothetical protein